MSNTSKNSHNFIKNILISIVPTLVTKHATSLTIMTIPPLQDLWVKLFFLSAHGRVCKIQICDSNRASLHDETKSRSASTLLSSYFSSTTLTDSKGFFSFFFQLFPLIILFILFTIIALYVFLQMRSRLRSFPIGFPLFWHASTTIVQLWLWNMSINLRIITILVYLHAR